MGRILSLYQETYSLVEESKFKYTDKNTKMVILLVSCWRSGKSPEGTQRKYCFVELVLEKHMDVMRWMEWNFQVGRVVWSIEETYQKHV